MPLSISPPTTDIEILSQAVMLCGGPGFNTIESGGPFAQAAAAFYGSFVSGEIASNRWRFAEASQQVASLTTLNPAFDGWNYYYDLPSDLLMFHHILPRTRYAVFGDRLLTTSNQPITIVYTKNVPVSKWPPAFSLYIIYSIAAMLAQSVTNSDALRNSLQNGAMYWRSRALFPDGSSTPPTTIRSNPWVEVRYGYYNQRGRS